MQKLAENLTIKLDIEHNLSSMKMIEIPFQANQNILSVKETLEQRYGTFVNYMQLNLMDKKHNPVAELDKDMSTLGSFGAETGMIIRVTDLNPNSIHKELENFDAVEKYVMSDEDYDKLPVSFRKWKKAHPEFKAQKHPVIKAEELDSEYLGQIAATINLKDRCKVQSGARGSVQFVGKISDLGSGFWVGVKLDQPFGNTDGKVKGVTYFEALMKYGQFVRPDKLQVGDFPELGLDDEI